MIIPLLKLAGSLLHRLPDRINRMLAAGLGMILFSLLAKRRRTAHANLQRCFPQRDAAWRSALIKEAFKRMVEMGLLSLVMPSMSSDELRRRFRVPVSTRKTIAELTHSQRAIVSLVPHMTLTEVLTTLPTLMREAPTTATLYRPMNQKAVDAWVKQTRERFGVTLLSRRDGLHRARRHLNEGGCLCVLFDQNAGEAGILTLLFDRLASSTELPGILQQHYRAHLVVSFFQRTGFWQGDLHCEPMPQPSDATEVTLLADQWLENRLKTDPAYCADWLWLHDRWKAHAHQKRFHLRNKRNQLARAMVFQGRDSLPRQTRIWLRMPNWLGDCVMALPLIAAIRDGRPDAHITLLAKPAFTALLEQLDLADQVIALPSGNPWQRWSAVRQFRSHYPDCQVLFTNSLRGDLEAALIGATQRIGWQRPGKLRPLLKRPWQAPQTLHPETTHQSHLWHVMLAAYGLQVPLVRKPLSLPKRRTRQPECPVIGIIAGTENAPEKRWPVANWRAVLKKLPEDSQAVLFGTTRDAHLCRDIAEGLSGPSLIDRSGKTDLVTFAAELAQCTLVVGNDTGGLHLANALGVPVIGLYGPTNPVRTGPIFDAPITQLQPAGCPASGGLPMDAITVADVLEAIRAQLSHGQNTPSGPSGS